MRSLSLLAVLLASQSAWAQSDSADAYAASEESIAKAGLLANIGPSGSKAQGAKAGIVIASPSTVNPNYLFTWIRDAALVSQTIIDQVTFGIDSSLRDYVDNYVLAQKDIQQVANPSGSVSTGGLGEPKFNINGTAFTGPWGRPQRDGPALRSNALMTYANWLISQGNTSFVTDTLWPMIKLDLDYTAANWNQSTYDLWEEVSSSSFWTTAVQHRSLRQGAALASKLSQDNTAYTKQADNLLCFLQTYWNPSSSYITANTGGGRSGIDSNTVLASIHTFDASAGCDAATFQPCSDKALANLLAYVNSFRSVYSINSNIPSNQAIATGRYPEDVYFGGNPWYLTTLAVAEQLYDALSVWKQQGSLEITDLSKPFFQLFQSDVASGTYSSSSSTFQSLTSAIRTYADGFVAVVAKYTPSNGALAEQFSKSDGTPLSAADLTWSYASALTALSAKSGFIPASWSAKGVVVPSTCEEGADGGAGTVAVTFNVEATTTPGENIYLTGSVDALANWSPDNAIALSADKYPTWSVTVNVPASTLVQYKFIRKFNGAVTWESDPNRELTTPASGPYTENDTWR